MIAASRSSASCRGTRIPSPGVGMHWSTCGWPHPRGRGRSSSGYSPAFQGRETAMRPRPSSEPSTNGSSRSGGIPGRTAAPPGDGVPPRRCAGERGTDPLDRAGRGHGVAPPRLDERGEPPGGAGRGAEPRARGAFRARGVPRSAPEAPPHRERAPGHRERGTRRRAGRRGAPRGEGAGGRVHPACVRDLLHRPGEGRPRFTIPSSERNSSSRTSRSQPGRRSRACR